ncbi:hypothetical protein FBY04_11019 [Pseudomonas sp. SJZ080]|uniref:hypothetical protein n=1 Tax=Pseudomonas sp. SJZ080 TaxID=2572888 RepID=UPI00119912B2|nr:hypothetical protein [Pseudomonas sp. SJZ080]TWC55259.1 hypothetical protein FBY04_11019 [Pseudomonas sp. SJZ080]
MANEMDESVEPLVFAPDIITPPFASTVEDGFLISASAATVSFIIGWRVEIWFSGESYMYYPTDFNPGPYSRMNFYFPRNLIPAGRKFHFEVDYQYGIFNSPWALSGDLTMTLPKPVITNVIYSGGAVRIEGRNGVFGARMMVWEGLGSHLFDADIAPDGSWTRSISMSLTPRKGFPFTAQQSNDSGLSEYADNYFIDILPPKPVITGAETSPDGYLTVHGTNGYRNAQIKIWREGGTDGVLFIVDNPSEGAWTVSDTRRRWVFPPQKHSITAQQFFYLDSAYADTYEFYVLPPTPVITQVEISSDGYLTVHGSNGYPNAQIKIWRQGGTDGVLFSGTISSAGPWTVSDTNRRWIFPPHPKHVILAQQYFNLDSAYSSEFEFEVRPPKPEITPPASPIGLKQTLDVTNIGLNAETLKMLRSGIEVPGSFTGTGSSRTFTPSQNWLSGSNTVSLVQIVGGVSSDPSEPCTFTVSLEAPEISGPTTPSSPRPTFAGKGVDGATVDVVQHHFASPILATATVENGQWTATLAESRPDLPAGSFLVTAMQTLDGFSSGWFTPAFEIKVKPPKPVITPPTETVAPNQSLTITRVYSGAATVALFDEHNLSVAGEFSGTGAVRTFTPAEEWVTGSHTVKAKQAVAAVDSDFSEECTFIVEEQGERPEIPTFELPRAGTATSTRPDIRVKGSPDALITVKLVGAEVLCSAKADPTGVLEFRVASALEPGRIDLEVKQKASGPDSGWSEAHTFVVNAPPKTPKIRNPRGSTTPVIIISGEGETRGSIKIRHEKEPEETEIAIVEGFRNWSWKATEPWSKGSYAIVAQQVDEGDHSGWSEPARTFDVIDARYGIRDGGRVLGQPVVEEKQSVLLRVQVMSGITGEPSAGVQVQWRLKGGDDVLATTETGPDGWANYRYLPGTEGLHEVLADITNDNDGVAMSWLFEVTALLHDEWAQEARLYLDGALVDLAKDDIVLLRGKPYSLELRVNSGSRLIGSPVILQDQWGAEEAGLRFDPAIGVPRLVEEGKPVVWSISFNEGDGAYFGLNLTCPLLSDWPLPGKVETVDFAKVVDLVFIGNPKVFVFGGEPAYPCIGGLYRIKVRPSANSPLLGKSVKLQLSPEAAPLGVFTSPPGSYQKMVEGGVEWALDCHSSVESGAFSIGLRVSDWDVKDLDLSMCLGHNKVKVVAWSPPSQDVPGGKWKYGAFVRSVGTELKASGVPVTIDVSGVVSQGSTNSNGYIEVEYDDGQSARLEFHNRYDGSSVFSPE